MIGDLRKPQILILCDPILLPSNTPRVTSLVHYLQEDGWRVTLESGKLPEKQSLCAKVADKLLLLQERRFARKLMAKYKEGEFDVILCSTYYYFPLWTALRLSKAWHIPFYADLRDIAEQWGHMNYFTTPLPRLGGLEKIVGRWYERRNIRMRNNILRQAAGVSTISPWHRELLQGATKAKVECIYNGFDEREFAPENRKTDVFRVAFLGRIIQLELRQPQMLFEATGELLKEGKVNSKTFALDFYCEPEFAESLHEMAESYGAAECLHYHGYIPRTALRDVMAESSILVALGASADYGQHGILGTKVFESIGMEKPFVLVPSDKDSLATLIKETGIGLAAEDKTQLKTFLMEQYAKWQAKGYTRQPVNNKEIFSRRYQAQQFEQFMHGQ